MKKHVDLNYRLMLQASVGYLVRALGVAFLVFTLSLIIFASFAVTYSHTNLGIFVGLAMLSIMAFSANMIFYILSVSFRTGTVVSMDRKGLLDEASFVRWGLLKIEEIDYIKFSYSLFGDFLKVKMKRELPVGSLSGIRKWNARFIAYIDPYCVYIPLDVLDVTRMNLETQLLHFGALMKLSAEDKLDNSTTVLDLMREKYEKDTGQMPEAPPAPEGIDISEMTKTSYEVVNETGSFDAPAVTMDIGTNTASHTFVPPKLDPSASEKSRLIQQISALKDYVKKKKLDQKICDFYMDYAANFPRWEDESDPRLPVGVRGARYVDKQDDYEELLFTYKDFVFQFSLRKDIGPSDMALLSVGFQGRVKMALRASVEIAALEPKDIEVFHRDHWEKYFLELHTATLAGRFGSQPMRELDAETATRELDLERLKDNFSVDEDS